MKSWQAKSQIDLYYLLQCELLWVEAFAICALEPTVRGHNGRDFCRCFSEESIPTLEARRSAVIRGADDVAVRAVLLRVCRDLLDTAFLSLTYLLQTKIQTKHSQAGWGFTTASHYIIFFVCPAEVFAAGLFICRSLSITTAFTFLWQISFTVCLDCERNAICWLYFTSKLYSTTSIRRIVEEAKFLNVVECFSFTL